MQTEIISDKQELILTRNGYADKWLWLAGYPLLALSMIFIANDNSLVHLLSIPSFYTDLLFAVVASFSAGFYIKKITIWLDAGNPWHHHFKKRVQLQLVYGLVLPVVIIISLELIYLIVIGIPIEQAPVFYLELPLSFLFLLLINLFYLVHYLFYSQYIRTIKVAEIANTMVNDFILVQVGFSEKQLPVAKCSLLISKAKIVWLYTFSGERFRLTGSMDEWEQKLKGFNFFRLNRQVLCTKTVISAIEHTSTRKLLVRLPHFIKEEVYVSKEKARDFQSWWRKEGLV